MYAHNRRKMKAARLDRLSNPDYQLDRLRNITGAAHSMEYNPNYDFGGTMCNLQDLKDVPRENLVLVR